MASKRSLKKSIKFICGNVAGECLFSEIANNLDNSQSAQLVVDLAELQDNTIRNITFSFDKSVKDFDSAKSYNAAKYKYNKKAFATLRTQFNEKLGDIVKSINALIPAEEKEANKKK